MTDKKIRIIFNTAEAKSGANEINQATKSIGKSADSSTFSVNKLAAAIATVVSVQKVAAYADSWTRVENQLKRTTKSQEDLAATSRLLLDLANETRSQLEPTVDLYTAITVATQEMGLSQQGVVGITRTVNNLVLESGKTAEQTAGAIRQLGQAFDKGILNGDEFVSVSEGMPGILRAIQAETGKTRAELRKMSEQGELTAELLAASLSGYSEEAQKAADKTKVTLGQAFNVSGNNIAFFVGKLDNAVGATEAFSSALVSLTSVLSDDESLRTIFAVLEGLTVVLGARLVSALALSAAGFIANQAAALKATAAITTTTTATSIYTGAVTRATVVTGGTTVAMNVMAASARAASAALAFLGGPVGILAIAATALVYYGTKADEAATATDVLAKSTDGLTVANARLQQQQVADAIADQSKAADDAALKIEYLTSVIKIAEAQGKPPLESVTKELVVQKSRADDVALSVDNLKKRYEELDKVISSGGSIKIDEVINKKEEVTTSNSKIDDDGSASERAAQQTKALQAELQTRIQAAQIYRENILSGDKSLYDQQLALLQISEIERNAQLDAQAVADSQRRLEILSKQLEDERLAESTKILLKAEFAAQEAAAAQILEEQKTSILQEGIKAREDLDRAERDAKIANVGALGDSIMQISKTKNKAIFKVGQALSLASAAAALPSAVVQSFQNGGGYPWGLVPAAAMLATGLKQIQGIKDAGKGLGGGGGSVSVPSISGAGGVGGGGNIPTTASQTELTQQKRVIDLRGIGPDSLLTGEQLKSVLEGDDSVIVAFENAKIDARRRNVIGAGS